MCVVCALANQAMPSLGNTSCSPEQEESIVLSTQYLVTASGVAMTLMVTLGLLGNTAVIFGLVKFGRATNPYFFIITIMAVIDLLVCLVDVPLYGVFTLNNFRWPVARVLCKPYLIADYLLCSMSSYCVAILSYDRSVLVMEPLRYQKLQTRRKVTGILACCLVLANFHTPLILFWPDEPGHEQNSAVNATGDLSPSTCQHNDNIGCSVQYEDSLTLQLCGVLIQFFLPFAATVISSCLVYWRMRERKQLFYTLQGGIAQFAGQDRMLRLAGKASRRAGRWLILFDSIYTIMWLPCMSMVVIRTLVAKELFSPAQPLFHLFQLCWWLLLCNSVVNPFLYIRSCDAVCSFYLKVFCRCCPIGCGRLCFGRDKKQGVVKIETGVPLCRVNEMGTATQRLQKLQQLPSQPQLQHQQQQTEIQSPLDVINNLSSASSSIRRKRLSVRAVNRATAAENETAKRVPLLGSNHGDSATGDETEEGEADKTSEPRDGMVTMREVEVDGQEMAFSFV